MSPIRALLRAFFSADLSRESEIGSPWRNRRALVALVPLALLFAAVIVAEPWYSNFDVDSLTHFEQVRSVAQYGVPAFPNGPVVGNPELTPRWLVPAHGMAWGTYPATMAYVLAPAMRLGGFRGTLRFIWLLYACACLMTYALSYRLTRRPALAVAAAYSLGVASWLPFWGTMMAPFIPVAAFGVTSVYVASGAFAQPSTRRSVLYAALAGLLASCAVGGHLLFTLAWAGLGAALVAWGSVRERVVRAAAYGAASAPSFALMAWVNHARFDTWNPLSYGPCNLGGCLEGTAATNPQNGGAFLEAYAPLAPYVLALVVALVLVRRSPRALAIGVLAGCAAALLPDAPHREKLASVFRCLWGYLVDEGSLDTGFPRVSDALGTYNNFWTYAGPYCTRSLLQCSPVLVGALLATRHASARNDGPRVAASRAAHWMLLAVCAGVLGAIAMRADLPVPHSFGMSLVNHRYLVPIAPAVTVLACTGFARLPLRPWHALLALAVGVWGAARLSAAPNDADLLRRQVTLWLPLAMAFVLWTLAAAAGTHKGRARHVLAHAAAALAAVCLGYGAAVTFGVDRVAIRDFRGYEDGRVAELERCTPERFALLGGFALDESLVLQDRREIYAINPGMGRTRDGANARRLLEPWLRQGLPAYLLEDDAFGRPWQFDWPGIEFRRIPGCPRVLRIVPTGAPAHAG